MNAVDTNILIYVNDARDPGKQAIAASLVADLTDGVLIWQVACEYLAASRKLEPLGYDRVQAYQYIRDLQQVWYVYSFANLGCYRSRRGLDEPF